ncbi:MAG: hypothetical protein AAF412_15220 [Pseudomonadota bacterium]
MEGRSKGDYRRRQKWASSVGYDPLALAEKATHQRTPLHQVKARLLNGLKHPLASKYGMVRTEKLRLAILELLNEEEDHDLCVSALRGLWAVLYAEALNTAGQYGETKTALSAVKVYKNQSGQHLYLPEVHRLMSNLAAENADGAVDIECELRTVLRNASDQENKGY